MKKAIKQNLVLWMSSIALLAFLVLLLASRFEDLETRIELLEQEEEKLLTELQHREGENKDLVARLEERDAEIERLHKPQVVNGPAEFPIARVLVRSQDTVEIVAQRENTVPQVIYALNPWLDGEIQLIEGQALWIPVR